MVGLSRRYILSITPVKHSRPFSLTIVVGTGKKYGISCEFDVPCMMSEYNVAVADENISENISRRVLGYLVITVVYL
jgi:hypothetical protein